MVGVSNLVAQVKDNVEVVSGNAGILNTPIRTEIYVHFDEAQVVVYKRTTLDESVAPIPLSDYVEEKKGGDFDYSGQAIFRWVQGDLFRRLQRYDGVIVANSEDGRHMNDFSQPNDATHEMHIFIEKLDFGSAGLAIANTVFSFSPSSKSGGMCLEGRIEVVSKETCNTEVVFRINPTRGNASIRVDDNFRNCFIGITREITNLAEDAVLGGAKSGAATICGQGNGTNQQSATMTRNQQTAKQQQSGGTEHKIYLKNGSVIKCNVVEYNFTSTGSTKIETSDGSTFVWKNAEIKKIEREETDETPRLLVSLKNGSAIKSNIAEEDFATNVVKLQTGDGSIFVYKTTEVAKVEKVAGAVADKGRSQGVANAKAKSVKTVDASAYRVTGYSADSKLMGGRMGFKRVQGRSVDMTGTKIALMLDKSYVSSTLENEWREFQNKFKDEADNCTILAEPSEQTRFVCILAPLSVGSTVSAVFFVWKQGQNDPVCVYEISQYKNFEKMADELADDLY